METLPMLFLLLAVGFLVDMIRCPDSFGLIELGFLTLTEDVDSFMPFLMLSVGLAVVGARAFTPQSILIVAFLVYVAIIVVAIRYTTGSCIRTGEEEGERWVVLAAAGGAVTAEVVASLFVFLQMAGDHL